MQFYKRSLAVFLVCVGIVLLFHSVIFTRVTQWDFIRVRFGEIQRVDSGVRFSELKEARERVLSAKLVKQHKIKNHDYRAKFNDDGPHVPMDERTCKIYGIRKKVRVQEEEKVACKDHMVSKSSCAYTRENYRYNEKYMCNKDLPLTICEFSQGGALECDQDACGSRAHIHVHALDQKTGKTRVVAKWIRDGEKLKTVVLRQAKTAIQSEANFLYLSCNGDIKKQGQLLLLNARLPTIRKASRAKRNEKKININLVMLDSISRAHFYRSLKKTVEVFSELNKQNSDAEIFDFERYQALHGHSAENAHALFTGTMFPKNFTDRQRENTPVDIGVFMEFMKRHGYGTLYQDDMCWEAIWGIRLDMGNSYDWSSLQKKIKNAHIDEMGLTHASCDMIHSHEIQHIFNTQKDEFVCYNQQQLDHYYLRYLHNHFSNLKPNEYTVSYNALNVAHDFGAVRIQTIDRDLAWFTKAMAKQDNTLTVLFADHGNTYTDYVYVDQEGRYEMYHPSMFMIVPKGVRAYLGEETMGALRQNQKRLFTGLDFHDALFYFAQKSSLKSDIPNKGLANVLPAERTCDDLPLTMPNLCVCENSHSHVKNNTDLLGIIEFAVGQLNNKIVDTKSNCMRLVPTHFSRPRVRKNGDFFVYSMDVHTRSGLGSANREETISVDVRSVQSGTVDNYGMTIAGFERISKFGGYRKCSRADQSFRYCVCDHRKREDANSEKNVLDRLYFEMRTSRRYQLFSQFVSEEIKTLVEKELILVIRRYKDGKKLIAVTFEAVAISDKNYRLRVTMTRVNNFKATVNSPCEDVVRGNSVRYLCTYARNYNIWESSFEYSVDLGVVV